MGSSDLAAFRTTLEQRSNFEGGAEAIKIFARSRLPGGSLRRCPAPDLRTASLGPRENIDRAAGHTCQGDDGYGGLQQHQHLGASGKRQSVGRAEREAGCEGNEQIVRVDGICSSRTRKKCAPSFLLGEEQRITGSFSSASEFGRLWSY